jgi:membrane protein DedA with SNARE-associated domain
VTVEDFTHTILTYAQQHAAYAPFIVGGLAFCESLAFLSLLVPATVLLIGIGALIGAGGMEFWPIWLGAAIGAILGDWLSYSLGFYFKDEARQMWPLNKNPQLLLRGEDFCRKYGPWGVFVGRFFGPLRAVVPLTAGIFAMPLVLFQAANIASGFVWSFVLLAPGAGIFLLFD